MNDTRSCQICNSFLNIYVHYITAMIWTDYPSVPFFTSVPNEPSNYVSVSTSPSLSERDPVIISGFSFSFIFGPCFAASATSTTWYIFYIPLWSWPLNSSVFYIFTISTTAYVLRSYKVSKLASVWYQFVFHLLTADSFSFYFSVNSGWVLRDLRPNVIPIIYHLIFGQ